MPKEYLVQVEGEPSPGAVRQLREGVDLEDGRTAPARVAVVSTLVGFIPFRTEGQ